MEPPEQIYKKSAKFLTGTEFVAFLQRSTELFKKIEK
jgi:hypothetical protein